MPSDLEPSAGPKFPDHPHSRNLPSIKILAILTSLILFAKEEKHLTQKVLSSIEDEFTEGK